MRSVLLLLSVAVVLVQGKRGDALGLSALLDLCRLTLDRRGLGAFYDKASGVVNLNAKNFDSTVKQEGQIFLVEFYAPYVPSAPSCRYCLQTYRPLLVRFIHDRWCGHCKNCTHHIMFFFPVVCFRLLPSLVLV
jgi:hypothetical protein